MSVAPARRFLPVLRRLDGELGLPIPRRLQFLTELESDLERLHDRLVEQGLTADEAVSTAIEALAPADDALDDLRSVHAPAYRRLTRRITEERLRMTERCALVLATVTVLTTEAVALGRFDLLVDASPFVWPVLGLGAAVFAAVAAKVFELCVKADHRAPRRGLGTILGLSLVAVATGFGGALVDFTILADILADEPGLAGVYLRRWVVRDAMLVAVAILIASAGGLAWFLLSHWVASMSCARRTVLGAAATPSVKEVRND